MTTRAEYLREKARADRLKDALAAADGEPGEDLLTEPPTPIGVEGEAWPTWFSLAIPQSAASLTRLRQS